MIRRKIKKEGRERKTENFWTGSFIYFILFDLKSLFMKILVKCVNVFVFMCVAYMVVV